MEKTPIGWWWWGGSSAFQSINHFQEKGSCTKTSVWGSTDPETLSPNGADKRSATDGETTIREFLQEHGDRKPRNIQERPDQRHRGLSHLIPDQIAASPRRKVKVASKERTNARELEGPSTFLGESVERGNQEQAARRTLVLIVCYGNQKKNSKIKLFFFFFF